MLSLTHIPFVPRILLLAMLLDRSSTYIGISDMIDSHIRQPYMCIYMCVCVCVDIHIYAHALLVIACIYVCIHVYIYIYIYMYI